MTTTRWQERGYCPRVFTPMDSGDGLLVRVRSEARGLHADALRTLATLSARYGNGTIDLTRRANLQLRGVQADTLAPLQRALQTHGLCAANREEESRQLLWVSPFSDLADDCADLSGHAQAVVSALHSVDLRQPLSGKFLIVLEGGGSRRLNLPCDVRLEVAPEQPDQVCITLATDQDSGLSFGTFHVDQLSPLIARLLALVSQLGPSKRMRDVLRDAPQSLPTSGAPRPAHGALLAPPGEPAQALFIGAQSEGFCGLGVPFGSGDSAFWTGVAELAQRHGDGTVRLTPLRTLVLPRVRDPQALLTDAAALGLITHADDPLLRVVACPGAPACAAAHGETRSLARELADTLRAPLQAGATLHVSGCAKGCAQSTPADFTLVHDADGAKLGRNRSARSTAEQPGQSLLQVRARLVREAGVATTPSLSSPRS